MSREWVPGTHEVTLVSPHEMDAAQSGTTNFFSRVAEGGFRLYATLLGFIDMGYCSWG